MRFIRIGCILFLASAVLVGMMLLRGRADAEPNELQALGWDIRDTKDGRKLTRRGNA